MASLICGVTVGGSSVVAGGGSVSGVPSSPKAGAVADGAAAVLSLPFSNSLSSVTVVLAAQLGSCLTIHLRVTLILGVVVLALDGGA